YNGTYTTGALTADTTFYVATRVVGCQEESSRIAIEVEVHPVPSAPSVVGTPVETNFGGTATLEVQNQEAHLVYNWYDASTGGTLVHTGEDYIVTNVTAPSSYFVEAAVAGSCASATRTEVAITINSGLLPPVVSPPILTLTEGESGTYTAGTGGNTNTNIEIV